MKADVERMDAVRLEVIWSRLLSIVEMMEADFGIPVIETCCSLVWEIQKRFHINEPREGCRRLLREMP